MQTIFLVGLFLVAVHAKKLTSSEIWRELGAELPNNELVASVEDEEQRVKGEAVLREEAPEVPPEAPVEAGEHSEDMTDEEEEEIYKIRMKMQEVYERTRKHERSQRQRLRELDEAYGIACVTKKCGLGKECVIDEDDEPTCVCAKVCPPEKSERAMVCSTRNVTFASECELHRQKCMCHREQLGCADPAFAHAHLDYFGPCVELRPCSDYEQQEFPLRMREWLYFVMEELAGRDSLGDKAKNMAKRAEDINADESDDVTETERWMIPAVWKFCELDETHDDLMGHAELIPITAPLKGMEHCISTFLQQCDVDSDANISRNEWVKCLQLDEKLIDKFELKCESFFD